MAVKKTRAVKREPTPAALLKKVAAVSDTNKALQKEIKAISKIFGENQKVLVSIKAMIDTLARSLEQIQRQSKQINIIESDTEKIFAELDQVRMQSSMITKINAHAARLQGEVDKISQLQKSQNLSQKVDDSMNSIKNNSEMIIKIAQRIDEVRDQIREASGKTEAVSKIGSQIEELKKSINHITDKTSKLESGSQIIQSLKQEFENITRDVSSTADLSRELGAIKVAIDAISAKASKIDSLGGVIDGLKQQFDTVSSRIDGSNLESIKELAGKMDSMQDKIGALSQKTDSTAHVGEGLESAMTDFDGFKKEMAASTSSIEQKISAVSDTLRRQDASVSEVHKKTDRLFDEIQSVKGIATKSSSDSSKEMMALLKLSEYQSSIRMNAESKYGQAKDLEKMARLTAGIVNLFEELSIESGERIPLPHEVRQWAVGKMLDCADKWEVRFGDVYSILANAIGRDMLKESIRIQQVRDIYGIRAVDEIRADLNIS